jgi:5'(3')-deoxyribonucleotidase
MKKVLLIDMDGVIVDLGSEFKKWFNEHPHLIERYETHPDHIHGIFRNPKPIEGAIEAIIRLSEKYDLFIASAAPWGNPEAATDKRYWLEKYFGNLFHKKLILTHRKDMLIGDYLIDDSKHNGAGDFKGELLSFGIDYKTGDANEYPDWASILKKLL